MGLCPLRKRTAYKVTGRTAIRAITTMAMLQSYPIKVILAKHRTNRPLRTNMRLMWMQTVSLVSQPRLYNISFSRPVMTTGRPSITARLIPPF